MKLVAIRYARTPGDMVAFYAALGLETDLVSRTGGWVELNAPSGSIAIHQTVNGDDAHPAGAAEIAFEAEEPLERVKARLDAAGYDGGVIVDENYGRSLRIDDPEGVAVWINESDPELFT